VTQGFFWDASTQRLGLGTTSPNKILHLETSGETVQRMIGGTTSLVGFYLGDADNGSIGQITYDNNVNVMRFHTNGGERVKIDSSGNVGIGTTSPDRRLQVKSDENDQLNCTIGLAPSTVDTVQGGIGVKSGGIMGFNAVNVMTFGIGGADGDGASEVARIDSSGNVGIGTSSPQQLLSLKANNPGGKIRLEMGQTGVANNDVTGEIQFYHNDASGAGVNADIKGICTSSVGAGALTFGTGTTSTTERMRIDSAGRVSINTTAATELLNVAASAGNGAGVEFAGNGTTVGSTSAFYGQGSGSDAYVWNRANNSILFGTNNVEKMRLESSGNLLVGTTDGLIYNHSGSGAVDGVVLGASGVIQATAASGEVLFLNRLVSDGTILDFRKDGSFVGSIRSRAGNGICLDSKAGYAGVLGQGGTNYYYWNNERFRPVDDNARDLGESSGRWQDLYLSGGAYLGGTGSANYLDDYEEGSFTPVLSGEGACTITTSTALGQYNKVGRIVNVTMFFQVSAVSGGSSGLAVQISGLPFTTNTNLNTTGAVRAQNLNSGLTVNGLQVSIYNNSTAGRIEEWSGSTAANLSDHITSLSNFSVSVTYSIT